VKTFVRILDYVTRDKFQLINITHRVNELVAESGLTNGVVHIQSLHTTTALFMNEWQEALLHDFKTLLESVVVKDGAWRHDDPAYSDCERHNAVAHLQGLILSPSLSLQVRDGKLLLGTWQSLILAELDGPRTRCLSLQAMGT
jgi:secondary thiamine-phosphate synthase enzyme